MASTSSSVMPKQVAAVDRAHVEAVHVVLGAEGEHLGKRRADFIADHGERKAGKGHALSLLCRPFDIFG